MEMEIYRERERLNNKQRIYGNRPKKNHSIDEVEVVIMSICFFGS